MAEGAVARLRAHRGMQFARSVGWRAALAELEHQAEHWDTPDHGETGHLIAQALRAAADIARGGGLDCEHRRSSKGAVAPSVVIQSEARVRLHRGRSTAA
jgi:hypothetical protein